MSPHSTVTGFEPVTVIIGEIVSDTITVLVAVDELLDESAT